MNWTLTHSYDKNISPDLMKNINPYILDLKSISKDDKMLAFNTIKNKIKDKIAVKYFDLIVNDDKNNYDPINNLDTIDLLYIVYFISLNNNNIIELLVDQLKDLQTGSCPQGRTIRLIQIIQPFI